MISDRQSTRLRHGCGLLLTFLTLVLSGCVSSSTSKSAAVIDKDRVLVDVQSAATALREGRDDEARTGLDNALATMGGIMGTSDDARRARSLFGSESSKVFIGEPYERVMAYYYRGILYWREGQPDNARACFRSGQFIDSDPVDRQYASDYVLLDYLEGLATTKLDGDGSDHLRRAQERVGNKFVLPPYDPEANVLVFAEFGKGPRKYASGEYGEQLKFMQNDSLAHSARITLDQQGLTVPLPAYDDLGFQAMTRGGRVMDHILGNKAVFKSTVDTAGDVALAGAIIAQNEAMRRDWQGRNSNDAEIAALGLGVLAIVGKVAAAATKTDADTRQWENLPQRLSFAAFRLPPGTHHGTLEFLDRNGIPIAHRTRHIALVVDGSRDTVAFFSELKH